MLPKWETRVETLKHSETFNSHLVGPDDFLVAWPCSCRHFTILLECLAYIVNKLVDAQADSMLFLAMCHSTFSEFIYDVYYENVNMLSCKDNCECSLKSRFIFHMCTLNTLMAIYVAYWSWWSVHDHLFHCAYSSFIRSVIQFVQVAYYRPI